MRWLSKGWVLVVVLALAQPALAAAPAFVPVQGYLTDEDGQPVDAAVTVRFTLWDRMMAGQVLFQEEIGVLVEQGFFTAYLGGAGDPLLDLALFRDQGELYLGIAVSGESEMSPRLPLGAVPYAGYAEYAGDALTLGGRAATDFRLGADQVSWDDLTGVPDNLRDGDADSLAALTCAGGQVAKWNGAAWACADDLEGGTGAGDITAVNAGDGLLGGALQGDVDLAVDYSALDARYARPGNLSQVAFSGDFGDLLNIPVDLLDGDADTLGGLNCGGGQVAKWNGNAWECAGDVDTDTDTAAPGTEHRIFGGLSWTAPFGGTVIWSGYSAWLYNGFVGSMPYIHALPVPNMFAGRGVVLDGVNVWYTCSAGSIDVSTVLSTDMPGSFAVLASSTASHPGGGGYYLPVGANVAGLLFLELVVTSPNASDSCSAIWRASYRY